jgi:5-methyltetrahydropteroyltriglutamate--homocysteine methyltransferase
VSDGELTKPGFSNYITDRFTGFEGRAEFRPTTSRRPEPRDAAVRHAGDGAPRLRQLLGPVEVKDPDAVHRDIDRLKRALGDTPPSEACTRAISPGHDAFHFTDHHYESHEKYLEALGLALGHEYRATTDAGFSLQIDSPDLAMAAHCRSVGSSIRSSDTHLPMAVEALNAALDGIPEQHVPLHVCWGNLRRPAP